MADVLIVEDDRIISELIRRTLSMTGHEGLTAYTGREALSVLDKEKVDLILMDIGLPDMDGFSLMKRCLEDYAEIPVICVTAKDEIPDRIRGLKGGAEDYIVKPFAMEELLARIQVVLRRFHKEQLVYRIRDLEIDLAGGVVKRSGLPVELTNREYMLFKTLLLNKNIALSRERLLELAWGRSRWYMGGSCITIPGRKKGRRQCVSFGKQIGTVPISLCMLLFPHHLPDAG